MRLHHGIRMLAAVLTAAAFSASTAYAAPTLTGKPYVPAPTMTGAPYAVAPTLTGRPYAPSPTLTGKPSAGNATAPHPSGDTTIWALIGLAVVALIGAGAAGSRRPSRRTARVRAVSGS